MQRICNEFIHPRNYFVRKDPLRFRKTFRCLSDIIRPFNKTTHSLNNSRMTRIGWACLWIMDLDILGFVKI
jgi:hypothetical protein